MKATVISVQQNITRQGKNGPYEVHLFKYQPDPYQGQVKQPTERPIFVENQDFPELAGKVAGLSPGQYIELTFVQAGKYKNISDVAVIGGQSPHAQENQQQQSSPAPQQSGGGTSAPPFDHQKEQLRKEARYDAQEARKQIAIGRQTCLKAGVDLVINLLNREGYYPKKMNQDQIIGEIFHFAGAFAQSLGCAKTVKQQQQSNEEPPLPEEPPFNPDDDIPF